jgi:hypothetical protein
MGCPDLPNATFLARFAKDLKHLGSIWRAGLLSHEESGSSIYYVL